MFALPKKGYLRRMRVYLAEMFPIHGRIASSVLLYVSFVSVLGRIHRVKISILSSHTLIGIWNILSLMLILRLMDELKDREIDQELFRNRPLPSGRVWESDIQFSLVVMTILYLAGNLLAVGAFWMAGLVLGYAFLMFRYFFIPRILRKHLLLNLATHNPVVPLMLLYLLILFSAHYEIGLRGLDWALSLLLIGMYWAMFFAWEIARKIRSKEEEDAYVTYSQIFGRPGAVLVAGGAQTTAFGIGCYFFWTLSLPGIYLVILAAGYGMTVWGHVRFLSRPNPVTSKLKPFAERYVLSIIVAQMAGCAFSA
jgi:4-hydroxybenzoate polyprenyltransferase